MARAVRSLIEARSNRLRLKAGELVWQRIEPGLYVGYRRPARGGAGTWWARKLVGTRYEKASLQVRADDHELADGECILSWSQAQARAREWAKTQRTSYTVADAVEDYCADLRARKGNAAYGDAHGRLTKRLLPVLGDRRLAELTASELLAWRNSLVADGKDEEQVRRSRDTANRLLAIAKAAFNLAFSTSKVADDRAWRKVQAFKGVGDARKIILDPNALQRLIDACEPGLRELVLAGALIGGRLGELTSAKVRDFVAADGTLRVQGKTGSREVHLPPDAVTLLRRLARGKPADAFLFTTATGGRWTKSLHKRPFARAVEKAGLDPASTFYALRHSWISRALVQGVPAQAAAEHCGTSLLMVQKFYGKFIPSQRASYAAIAAPALRSDREDKVVALR